MRAFILIICIMTAHSALADGDKLRVGTMYFIAPYVIYSEKGIYSGFDVSLMEQVCHQLKKKCVHSRYEFDNLFKALQENKIDIALGGIVITKEREKNLSFTLPYLLSNGIFFIRSNKNYNSLLELKGKKIGVTKGSVFDQHINENYPNFFKVVYVTTNQDIVDKLYKGKIEAGIMLNQAANYWISKTKGDFKTLGKPIKIGQGIGMVTLKKNNDLINKINKIIKNLENNGTYLKLYNLYFL